MTADPTDADRFPTLSSAGQAILNHMREHPNAPVFRNQSGNRLLAEDIQKLKEFDDQLGLPKMGVAPPGWVGDFIARAYETVPFYRALGPAPMRLSDVPPVSRSDFAADIAAFVPDDVPTDRMINFQTTGTTGHRMLIPSHPEIAGRYLSFHKKALKRFGITPQYGAGQVGVMLLGHQQPCFTYISVTPTMGDSGLIKLNLHPDEWQSNGDRAAYIDAMQPEFIAGDPLSFDVLLDIGCTWEPKALLSVSMMLTDGLRQRLESEFGCPVLDLYSLNEVGPIGVFDVKMCGHVLLQDRLWIETLNDDLSPNDQRGEITVTGGFNYCLPLLRYRTGDYGELRANKGPPLIKNLSGRAPVRFKSATGQWHNNIDVSHALKHLSIAQYALHQNADQTLVLSLSSGARHLGDAAVVAVRGLLGGLAIDVRDIASDDKVLQYTTDLA